MSVALKPRLWRSAEVARALGIHVSNLRKVRHLPEPWQVLDETPGVRPTKLWLADDVVPFARDFRERTGRPPLPED